MQHITVNGCPNEQLSGIQERKNVHSNWQDAGKELRRILKQLLKIHILGNKSNRPLDQIMQPFCPTCYSLQEFLLQVLWAPPQPLGQFPAGVWFSSLDMVLICKAVAVCSWILFSDNSVNLVSSQLCAVPVSCHCISSYLKTNGFAFVIMRDTLVFRLKYLIVFKAHFHIFIDL